LQEQIQLPSFQPLTGILHNYLITNDYYSREFHNNIQQYNTAFAMTLVGVKINNSMIKQSGSYCFKIEGETLIYVQIYILDIAEQLNVKRANNNNLNSMIIDNFQTILLDSHPYIS